MKLPLPFLEKKELPEFFLALILRDLKADAIIFEAQNAKIHIAGQHEAIFPSSIEKVSEEELLNVLDEAISGAEGHLPKNVETQKTVFGVKDEWVEDGKIKKEYLAKLKKASDELHLVPIGFLTVSEAIAHLLQKEEGAPVSAILAEVAGKNLTISLIRAGKIVESASSTIEGAAAATADSVLKHFTAEILPARIILFDGKKDLTQEFISHPWSKSLPFLHLPQITNLASGFDAKAVLFGAAEQMGFEVPREIITAKHLIEKSGLEEEFEKLETDEEKPKVPEEKENLNISDDLNNSEVAKEEPEQTENSEQTEDDREFFGFVKDEDVAKTAPPPDKELVEKEAEEPVDKELAEIPDQQLQQAEKRSLPLNAAFITQGMGKVLPRALKVLRKTFGLVPKRGGGKLTFAIPLIAILVIGFLLFYFFALSAQVTLMVSPKVIDKDQDILFSTTAATDPGKNTIAAEFVNVSEDGTDSVSATGKKQTGTNAKGTVTIFNNSSSSVSLTAGTAITSSTGLKFTLDKDTGVASASGDVFSGTKPGTANVSVTASTFGTEYNLPSSTKFTVGSNSSVAAKNDNPFSGGTKKDITVVSKDDVAKLLTDVSKNAEDKAKADLSKTISGDSALLPAFTSEAVSK
ncbi:MAG TPA: baseplate J/gp47 family protein, partial [Candidatus Saccharimonadales bacterium]|nr:baseplate J/gp47 family protein [Candidatus Saccharimonadales bacterium]